MHNIRPAFGAVQWTPSAEPNGALPEPMNAASADRGDPGSMKQYVMVADVDPVVCRTVVAYFEAHDVPARSASTWHDVLPFLAEPELALIVLDLRFGNGPALLQAIRAQSDVPVIIVAETGSEERERVNCLEYGADDCIARPFGLRTLLARFRAILRREKLGQIARSRDPKRGGYRFDGWRLERRNRRLIDPNGRAVPLTKREFALLLAFLEAPQRPLTREHLLQETRSNDDVFDRSIDVQVSRLRKKLKADATAPNMIRTERGVGYVLAATVEAF